MASSALGSDLAELYPVVEADLSDSGSLDCSVEFLMQVNVDETENITFHLAHTFVLAVFLLFPST